jgi:4'-phosphopantetheinyl transferase
MVDWPNMAQCDHSVRGAMDDPKGLDRPGSPGSIEIWTLTREAVAEAADRLEWLLTIDERGRCERFVQSDDRDRFIWGRVLCRLALSRWLGRPAAGIELPIGPNGRPSLANAPDGPWLNISHSGDLAALAIGPSPLIGLDVEQEDPGLEPLDLVGAVCTPDEAADIMLRPAGGRLAHFTALWTLKEAYVKATGLGLSLDPAQFGFDLRAPGLAVRLGDLTPAEVSAWRFGLWRPMAGYWLAIAARPTGALDLEIGQPRSAAPLLRHWRQTAGGDR